MRWDVLERFGLWWCVVKQRDAKGFPIKVVDGVGEDGLPVKGAELVATIITVVYQGSRRINIRFQATPYRDSKGYPYKPLIRGLCYIHPTKDVGMSSGKYLRELQIATNDTFNMSQDRVKMATTPTLVGRKYAMEDNSSVYFEPGHMILVDDPATDLTDIKIRSDVGGALQQIGMLQSGMQKVESVYPSQMGQRGMASTTATEVAGTESHANSRANYKSLTVEFTLLIELYNMIIQMTNQFMHMETAKAIMGDDLEAFDPDNDYSFQPVSSNIETEHNKYKKIALIDQVLGRVVNVPNPKTPMLLNKLLSMVFENLGEDYQDFSKLLLDENAPVAPPIGGTPPQQDAGMSPMPTTNQSGIEQGTSEQMMKALQGGM
jgi:hypothetical protein